MQQSLLKAFVSTATATGIATGTGDTGKDEEDH
jgi:hypothetical protein